MIETLSDDRSCTLCLELTSMSCVFEFPSVTDDLRLYLNMTLKRPSTVLIVKLSRDTYSSEIYRADLQHWQSREYGLGHWETQGNAIYSDLDHLWGIFMALTGKNCSCTHNLKHKSSSAHYLFFWSGAASLMLKFTLVESGYVKYLDKQTFRQTYKLIKKWFKDEIKYKKNEERMLRYLDRNLYLKKNI